MSLAKRVYHPSTSSGQRPSTPSPHHPITPSPHHPITPSPHHPITPPPCPGSRPKKPTYPRFPQSPWRWACQPRDLLWFQCG
ncbi:hypothetical protein E1H13_26440 [Nodosilinea sp. P-1105]|nr:hypothetical protein [Nodosilinea sp. P-1105]